MSLRQEFLNIALRLSARPYLRRVQDPVEARKQAEFGAAFLRTPPFTQSLPVPLGEVSGLAVRSGRVSDPRKIMLYFHGGGYLAGSPRTHRALAARISRLARVEVILPGYRLAPEHPFPAAMTDAETVWDHLMACGYAPDGIVLGGDSAGGGLALALLARLCARGTPPAGLVAFSPWTDMTGSGESYRINARRDPMLPSDRLQEARDFVLQGAAPDHPDASPLFAAFPGAPPVLIQHSETEILADDSLRMAARLRDFGAEVMVQSWPRAPHVWQLFDGYIPEARAALSDAARTIRQMLSLPPR